MRRETFQVGPWGGHDAATDTRVIIVLPSSLRRDISASSTSFWRFHSVSQTPDTSVERLYTFNGYNYFGCLTQLPRCLIDHERWEVYCRWMKRGFPRPRPGLEPEHLTCRGEYLQQRMETIWLPYILVHRHDMCVISTSITIDHSHLMHNLSTLIISFGPLTGPTAEQFADHVSAPLPL